MVCSRLSTAGSSVRDDPRGRFGAYFTTFIGTALAVGDTIDVAPGVKLTRRC